LNWKTFGAMLARDAHVARRNMIQLILQTFLQPLLFVFIFGRVMVGSGYMPKEYKSLLLPGIIAISMVFTGIWAVAMPLIAEFQWTREIEDRLLSPINISWIAIEKVIAGMIQALVAGLVVIPMAWLVLRPGVDIRINQPFWFIAIIVLVAAFSAAGGLALGCSINQQHIGLMFGMVITPMIFFGCAYYPWSALNGFPICGGRWFRSFRTCRWSRFWRRSCSLMCCCCFWGCDSLNARRSAEERTSTTETRRHRGDRAIW
jgi:ABC-2 type transport system permease protein